MFQLSSPPIKFSLFQVVFGLLFWGYPEPEDRVRHSNSWGWIQQCVMCCRKTVTVWRMVFKYTLATASSIPDCSVNSGSASGYKWPWVSIPPMAFLAFPSRAHCRCVILCVSVSGWLCTRHLNSKMNVGHSNGLSSNCSNPSFRSDHNMTDFTSLFTGSPSPLQSRCTHDTFDFSFSLSWLCSVVWTVLHIGEQVRHCLCICSFQSWIIFLIAFKVK